MRPQNLAQFKKWLAEAKENGSTLRSEVLAPTGEVARQQPHAPVSVVQANMFALKRNEQDSYTEFGKASQWKFTDNDATKQMVGGSLKFSYL